MNETRDKWNSDGTKFECSVSAFSDTVIVTMKGVKAHVLVPAMMDFLTWPFIIGIDMGMFFRGAVSSGKFYQSGNVLIGPAVDEAAEWYTKPQWIGVSTTPSASILVERALEDDVQLLNKISHYKVPLKKGAESCWTFSWPMHKVLKDYLKKKDITLQSWFLEAESNRPLDSSAKTKIDNTIKYIDRFTGRGPD